MKQEATFGSIVGYTDFGDRGICAVLSEVRDHPGLGDEPWVRTSRIERLEYGSNGEVIVVETKNTIYTRRS